MNQHTTNTAALGYPLQVRLPIPIREGLRQVARSEGNSLPAVARRLIAAGLAAELNQQESKG
jgi:hypothetical protein